MQSFGCNELNAASLSKLQKPPNKEILSDYGFAGEKWCPQSSFGGLFPDNLSTIFPWAEFFLSTQRDYLHKEEHVAGAHGVEARYPFLDPRVVQEYIWLAPDAWLLHVAPVMIFLALFPFCSFESGVLALVSALL